MTKIKICGLKDEAAIKTAVEAGADYIGFVFAPSKRQVTIEQAKTLAPHVKGAKLVGVFLNPTLAEIEAVLEEVPLDYVQIHGEWDEKTVLSKPLIRALSANGLNQTTSQAAFLLFDAPIAGSGQTFDWSLLENQTVNQDFFLAGGLTALNVSEAIQRLHPYAVDVSSGVETNGQKDHEKMKEFIEVVKHGISTTK